MEVEEAEVGERRERFYGSSEIEGRESESRDTVVWGANDAVP